jgi:hypothetical protein
MQSSFNLKLVDNDQAYSHHSIYAPMVHVVGVVTVQETGALTTITNSISNRTHKVHGS